MKPKKAVALRYEQHKENAPRVVAKGSGEVAEAIIRAAEENRVPVLQQNGLIESLIALELDSVIPEELYLAVAEILAYVYQERIR